MINLETSFMGLRLRNPLIVSSCSLTNSLENILKFEENGIGAVVIKSIFEEQINYEINSLLSDSSYPEAVDYMQIYAKNNSMNEYLQLLENAKKQTNIPIIASINCISSVDWTDFARKIVSSGADALELNIHILPTDRNISSREHEQRYFDIIQNVKKKVSAPILIKIGQNFTNLIQFVDLLLASGANGVTLFNRFYQPDIDIDNFEMTSSTIFSHPDDLRFSLPWVGVISGKIPHIEISASTGIHDGKAVIKQLLAGAQTVQISSTIYKNGTEVIVTMLSELTNWMKINQFDSVSEFRGRMNSKRISDPAIYERTQFMKYFSSFE
jgi:dihydroorotate dehydrogenase (fumarate)